MQLLLTDRLGKDCAAAGGGSRPLQLPSLSRIPAAAVGCDMANMRAGHQGELAGRWVGLSAGLSLQPAVSRSATAHSCNPYGESLWRVPTAAVS